VFDTTCQEREGSALINLQRISTPSATTAQASPRPSVTFGALRPIPRFHIFSIASRRLP
jgi:hypothetical protein